MPSKQELEGLDIIRLAVMCQKVADDALMDSNTAEKARQLKQEWVLLVARETPPPPSFAENEQIQVEKTALKKRMVELLMTV